jgi:RimJ/RimL family protein N-acetyltransferase
MNLKLSPLTEKDFDTLIRWAESPKDLLLWAGPGLKYPLTHQSLAKYLAPSKADEPKMYAYISKDEQANILGMCELSLVDRINGTATLCRIYVDKAHRGKGIAEHMIKQILKFGFEDLSLRRIDLRVYAFNTPAVKCYEKLGFVKEGNIRQFTKFENEYWDVLLYSMLAGEWVKLHN